MITQEKIFDILNCNCTDVIDMTPKAWSIKEKKKKDKLDINKIQNFCASKDTSKKVKR